MVSKALEANYKNSGNDDIKQNIDTLLSLFQPLIDHKYISKQLSSKVDFQNNMDIFDNDQSKRANKVKTLIYLLLI